ncbi:MAG TPA: hypothetical protein VGE98_08975, partial [Thermoanaerobaculia bacterium]
MIFERFKERPATVPPAPAAPHAAPAPPASPRERPRLPVFATAADVLRTFFVHGPLFVLVALPLLWLFHRALSLLLWLAIPQGGALPGFQAATSFAEGIANLVLPVVAQQAKAVFVGNVPRLYFLPLELLALGWLAHQMLLARRGDVSFAERARQGLASLLPLLGIGVVLAVLLVGAVVVPYLLFALLPRSAAAGLFLLPTLEPRWQLAYWLVVLVCAILVVLLFGLALPGAAVRRSGPFAALRASARLLRGNRWRALALLVLPLFADWLVSRIESGLAADLLAAKMRQFAVPPPPVATGWLALVHRIDLGMVLDVLLYVFVAATLAAVYDRLTRSREEPERLPLPLAASPARWIQGVVLLIGLPGALLYASTFPRPAKSWADAPPVPMPAPSPERAEPAPNVAAPPPAGANAEPAQSPYVGKSGWVPETPGRPTFELQTKAFTPFEEPEERAKRALRNLNRCLDAYLRMKGGGYPASLAALGPGGLNCAPAELVGDRDPALSIRYSPGPPDGRGYVVTYRLEATQHTQYRGHPIPSTPLASDETSLLFRGDDRSRTEALTEPILKLEWLDRQLRDYRRSHPDRGYPA